MGVKHYDKPFKEQAVKLSEQRGNISDVARELGISSSQLTKWRKDFNVYGENSFPGRGNERLTDVERENKELRKALKDKELDVEILKKAIAFFSRADK
jgi:transposase